MESLTDCNARKMVVILLFNVTNEIVNQRGGVARVGELAVKVYFSVCRVAT